MIALHGVRRVAASLLSVHCSRRSNILASPILYSVLGVGIHLTKANMTTPQNVYGFTVKTIEGEDVSLEKYRGHVLLIVNVASKCGLTSTNYKELVELDTKYREKGLRILAFPCNQFSNQEPGTNEDIVCFAKKKNANFDFFDKVDVNGNDAHPLWIYLQTTQKGTLGDKIKWNFTKFIVDKNGVPVERFAPTTSPLKLEEKLTKYLEA